MVPGATYTLWSSGDTTVAANGTDKIYVANNGVSSFKMGANDFVTLVWQQAGVWAVTSGSSVLGYTAAFGSLRSANGYQKLPSGLIIQWGLFTPSASGSTLTYPIAFPTICAAFAGTVSSVFNQSMTVVSQSLYQATKIDVQVMNSPTGAGFALPVSWIAIGY
jgi:hypothetical protein